MVCRACGFENPAGFKFCGRCASALALVGACVRCGFENPAGFRFCCECASPLTRAPADSPPARDLRAYTPKHLAEKILASKFALEYLGEFDVKGPAEAVRVFELQGPGAMRTRFDLSRARGDTVADASHLCEARSLFVEMGATGHAERLAKALAL